jgi:hypothetical protein
VGNDKWFKSNRVINTTKSRLALFCNHCHISQLPRILSEICIVQITIRNTFFDFVIFEASRLFIRNSFERCYYRLYLKSSLNFLYTSSELLTMPIDDPNPGSRATESTGVEKELDLNCYESTASPMLGENDKGIMATTQVEKDIDGKEAFDLVSQEPDDMDQEKSSNEQPNVDTFEYPQGPKLVIIIAALCLAVFLVALDQTIISTAIPKITDTFHSVDDIGWRVFLLLAALRCIFIQTKNNSHCFNIICLVPR